MFRSLKNCIDLCLANILVGPIIPDEVETSSDQILGYAHDSNNIVINTYYIFKQTLYINKKKTQEYNLPLCLAFVDYKKVFDLISIRRSVEVFV